jgi:hypothetical protein
MKNKTQKLFTQKLFALFLTLCLTLSLSVPAFAAGTAVKVEQDVWTINFYDQGGNQAVTVTRLLNAYETSLAGITIGSTTYSISDATDRQTDAYGNVTQATWTDVTYNSGDAVTVQETTTALTIVVDAEGNETILKKSALSGDTVTALLSGSCTVKAVDNTKTFADVGETWYTDAVAFASSHGLFTGIGDGQFDPEGLMTRAEVATTLQRLINLMLK